MNFMHRDEEVIFLSIASTSSILTFNVAALTCAVCVDHDECLDLSGCYRFQLSASFLFLCVVVSTFLLIIWPACCCTRAFSRFMEEVISCIVLTMPG